MASAMKFLFENSFDAAEQPAADVQPEPPQQITEEDIRAARDEGFAQGEAAARPAAMVAVEQSISQTLTAISGQLSSVSQNIEQVRSQIFADSLKVVSTAIHKVVPTLARHSVLNEIERLIRECLQAIYDEPRVVVRGHDRIISALQPRIDAMAVACGFQGKIVLFPDDQFNETDCRVEWADGGAERNLDDVWRQIETALQRMTEGDAETPSGSETSKA
jgi:flagellar assembly protein FliH